MMCDQWLTKGRGVRLPCFWKRLVEYEMYVTKQVLMNAILQTRKAAPATDSVTAFGGGLARIGAYAQAIGSEPPGRRCGALNLSLKAD